MTLSLLAMHSIISPSTYAWGVFEDTNIDSPGDRATTLRKIGERTPQSEGNWTEKERIRESRSAASEAGKERGLNFRIMIDPVAHHSHPTSPPSP